MLSSPPAGHVRLVYGCESAMYTCFTFGRFRKLLFAHRWAFELEFYRHMGYEEVDEWFWDQMLECLVEEADRQDLRALWERELSLPLPQFATGADLVAMLRNVVNPLLYVFLELDQPPPTHFLPEWKEPEPQYSPRLPTEHYIVVEAVDANDKPVSGVRLELLIADGEIKSATTGSDGIARVERIQAGNVVIRVLDMDGSMWRPESGAPAQESSRGRHSVHVVQRGESLSRIAKRYGLKNWKVIWDDPKNEPLRNKRKNPNVLHPGDEVYVPGVQVFEIYRETDATHRIVVEPAELDEFRLVLQDHNQQPFKNEAYEMRLSSDPNEQPRQGKTDGQGKLIERISPDVQHVEVKLPRLGLSWSFSLNKLEAMPADESEREVAEGKASQQAILATQMRLNALGFPCGEPDGVLNERTRQALALMRGGEQSGDSTENGIKLLAMNEVVNLFTV